MPLRGGVGRLMANAILNFHFDYWNTSLKPYHGIKDNWHKDLRWRSAVVEQNHMVYPQGCTERIVGLLEENINYLLFAGLGLVLLGGTLFSIKVFFSIHQWSTQRSTKNCFHTTPIYKSFFIHKARCFHVPHVLLPNPWLVSNISPFSTLLMATRINKQSILSLPFLKLSKHAYFSRWWCEQIVYIQNLFWRTRHRNLSKIFILNSLATRNTN